MHRAKSQIVFINELCGMCSVVYCVVFGMFVIGVGGDISTGCSAETAI